MHNTQIGWRNMKFHVLFTTPVLFLFIGCGSLNPQQNGTQPIDHSNFDHILKTYVDTLGNVDYQGLSAEREQLDQYLSLITNNPPNDEHWSKNDQMAYWINAYNAFTLQLILDHYPVKSIKDIGSKIQIPFVNTPWDIKFIKIGEETYDLNNIEHNILRKNFNEPRIHFAIVCASYSCPKLRREAYTGAQLDDQLTEQARNFLSDPNKNSITQNELEISKIFSWFKGDFTKGQTLIEFLDQYVDIQIDPKARIKHMDYIWTLNDQQPKS